ncbi:DUF3617 domain-containing protein [Sphingomonas sp. BAUL-RG-20F-R05-02]|uniref:DUF3617 domain-containing protein n=1 Tax=Sphingomonas sp. BAUL-RG-20F-R05-02 TaxID=2914830 RepID=UPI001F59B432|nr:DUF3617 family protein [Sphingomonas sp. BAUL-RG-20F-R05-02]
MISLIALALAMPPVATVGPMVQPGAWEVKSKLIDLTIPGVPSFFVRMARGKTKVERKQISAGQGIEALLAPDPKAQCRIESQTVANGRYTQTLTCPQKKGTPMRIVRVGSYDTTGFVGQAIVTGAAPKGALRIVLDQRAIRAGA